MIFNECNRDSAHGRSCPVQGMYVGGFALGGAVANVEPARLVIGNVRTAHELAVRFVYRSPVLHVELLVGWRAKVTASNTNKFIRYLKLLAQLFCYGN